MGDKDQGCARGSAEIKDKISYGRACDAVKITCWFVGQKKFGFGRQSAGKGDALLLTAGKLRGEMACASLKSHGGEARAGLAYGIGRACELKRERDIFERGERWNKVERLEDNAHMSETELCQGVLIHLTKVLSESEHLTACRALKAPHEHEERRFARPRRPRECERLGRVYGEADARQNGDGPCVA